MATTFSDLGSVAGMKKLDDYLSTRRHITGAMSGESADVTIEGSSSVEGVATPTVADEKSAAADEDDVDVDLFGGETEEEKKAAEERAVTSKVSSKMESGKSSVLLDVKPRDDETDMKKLEETVRGIRIEGLLWGAYISLIYHMIRGRGTIKLYVAFSVLESFGGDVLQTLFNSAEVLASCTRENMASCTGRHFSDLAMAVAASIVHWFILLTQAITLSTCIVAHNNVLLAMLVSNNFAEIKSNVFKRFSKDNILSINALMVFFCEIVIDTIKHSLIAKFNDIKPIVYSEFLEDPCKQTLNIQTDLKKNLTFVPLAPAFVASFCGIAMLLVIWVLTPVHAVLLPHHSFPWKLFWVVLLVFMTYVMLASLRVMIHMWLQKHGK